MVKAVRRGFGAGNRRKNGKALPIEFTVVATGGTYRIYYFENLDLYVKAKSESTEPGFQPSESSLKPVTREFVERIFETFKVL